MDSQFRHMTKLENGGLIILTQTLCARKESMNFDIVWEDCIQQEARVANKEALLKEDDEALSIHTKGIKQSKFKKGNHKPSKKKFQKKIVNQKKYYSKYQCHNCHKIGHLARECSSPKNNNNKRHHAHLAEDEDEKERPRKRLTKEEDVDEYVLFSALSCYVTLGEDMAY